jgi:hypothetical protein
MGHIVEGLVRYLANNANHPAFETLSMGMVAKSLFLSWATVYI